MTNQANGEEHDRPIQTQSVSITLTAILSSAMNGVVAYIAVYFFKPLWEKLMNHWNKPK